MAAALPFLAAAQQSGVLVEDFTYVLGAENYGITVAPNGTVYSAGAGYDDPSYTYRGLITASADDGNTWTAPLFVDSVPGYDVKYRGIAADSAGNLYVSGWSDDTNITTPYQWIVKRSSDGGATWTTVDDYAPGSFGALAAGLAVDAMGNVFVAGDPANPVSWLVRRGIGGANFTTVDSISAAGYSIGGIFVAPAGIFVVGGGPIPTGGRGSSAAWLVRRSTDGGNTWHTVDTFQYSSGVPSFASGGGVDSHGNIYVVGNGNIKSGRTIVSHRLVRKSSNGGSTWSTVDDFATSSSSSGASAFAADSNGNLFVVGTSGASGYWTVRKNPGGTGTWSIVDISPYEGAAPGSIAANATGNVFVAGQGSVNGVEHWLIKRY